MFSDMAKIISPLFSATVQGTIDKKITFSGSLGGARAFAYILQSFPPAMPYIKT